MACSVTLAGISRDCGVNLSGVKNAYIINYDDVTSVTAEDGKISALTLQSSAKFSLYIPAKNTGSLTKTLTRDDTTGVKYYTNEVVMNFNKMEYVKRQEIAALDSGQFAVVVEDNNGKYWYLGKDNPVIASAVTGQTGAGVDDGNFYTVTLQDFSGELPYEVDASVIAKIKGDA